MDKRRKIMKNINFSRVLIYAVTVLLLLTAANTRGVSPSARAYHQMAYNSELELVILYGGQTGEWSDPTQWNHETWSFDPQKNKWKQMSPDGIPGGSLGGSMTYDSKADRSILVVMSDDWTASQTWAHDANTDTWTRLADGPVIMLGHRIAYDAESDRTIMFGGLDMSKYKLVDETWVYDYNTDTWTNMEPRVHPEARNYHGMAYDPKADRIVVWGGDLYGKANKTAVWTYDYNTNTWQELDSKHANPPELRDYMNLVYDEKADRFIMYGGYPYGNDETWVYDLNTNTWQQMHPTNNPGIISRYAMVYAKDANKIILFGGQDGATSYQYNNETWSYNLKKNEWSNVSP
jgi:N-acetylneuraminic acid mutarotase